MRRLERLHAITNHLRVHSPRPVSAAVLADRFRVSRRTIERDLRSLNDAGVPIYGSPGRTGGYAILPEYSLPPVQLTAKEAAACVAALGLMDRSPLAPHARTALDKLRAALPEPVKAAATAGPVVMTVVTQQAQRTAAWLDAVRDRALVKILYENDPAPRLVEPYTTLEGGGFWYLVGWCRTREGVRGFRTDRVAELSVTAATFEPNHVAAITNDLARWAIAPLT
ncbi:WYL domain-containing protein [Nocardia sp. NPDC005745]|uniref:helix-turn-helix transcriptional regulator n=1 Tax=Nocardia sp. NPDC005745 TaxID=3157061 RepID=UPI0033C1F438